MFFKLMTHVMFKGLNIIIITTLLTQLIHWLSHLNVSHFAVLSVLVIGVEFLEVTECATWVQALGACQGAEADLIAFTELHITT